MQKTIFEIKCSDCGKTTRIPFKPAVGKPAYCKICLSKRRFTQSENVIRTNSFDPKQVWARRRANTQEDKVADQPIMFHWSYSTHDKAVQKS